MRFINVRPVLVGLVALGILAAAAETASAQELGAPSVTLLPDNSAVVSYSAPSTPPAGATLVATFNGQPIGSIAIGSATSFYSGRPLIPGEYTVQVVWSATVASPVTSISVGPPPGGGGAPEAPIMRPGVVSNGNTVTLNWDALPNATGYDLEAVFFESGQVFRMTVGLQPTLVVTNVPFGNYLVRVRGRNSVGVGPYSNQVLVTIGPTIRLRDLEVTLTWNTLADMDLHIIEPNGNHVYWERKNGITAFFDGDNTTGFGPETTFVHPGGAALGVYQVYLVHYRNNFPTVSTIAITLNVGQPNARTEIFTRQTAQASSTTGINVALVDVRGGLISETFGTRSALEIQPAVKPQ